MSSPLAISTEYKNHNFIYLSLIRDVCIQFVFQQICFALYKREGLRDEVTVSIFTFWWLDLNSIVRRTGKVLRSLGNYYGCGFRSQWKGEGKQRATRLIS